MPVPSPRAGRVPLIAQPLEAAPDGARLFVAVLEREEALLTQPLEAALLHLQVHVVARRGGAEEAVELGAVEEADVAHVPQLHYGRRLLLTPRSPGLGAGGAGALTLLPTAPSGALQLQHLPGSENRSAMLSVSLSHTPGAAGLLPHATALGSYLNFSCYCLNVHEKPRQPAAKLSACCRVSLYELSGTKRHILAVRRPAVVRVCRECPTWQTRSCFW